MEKFFWTIIILAVGLYIIGEGVMIRCGRLRKRFIGGSFPVLAPRDIFLIAIPIGLQILVIGFMIILPNSKILTVVGGVSFLSAIILGIWRPDWLKPSWLRWLENNYAHVRDEMFREANQMGAKKWEDATCTQEGLEHWADSVAKKHGWSRRWGERDGL